MPDIALIAGTVSALHTAGEIAKALIGLRDAAVIHDKVIELQAVILSAQQDAIAAQSEQFTLLEEIRGLKEQVAKLKAWEAEKQKYELTELKAGVFAYQLKATTGDGAPVHRICATCYDRGEKSVLQRQAFLALRAKVENCNNCGSRIYIEGMYHPDHDSKSRAAKR